MCTILPHINLRAIELTDLEVLYAIENDRTIWKYGCTNVPYSHQSIIDYITSCRNNIFEDGQLRQVICNEKGNTVGLIDLTNYSPQHHRAEISIVILPQYQNKGFAKAAIKEMTSYCKEILSIHSLHAIVSMDNVPMIKVFQHCGFREDAILKDWLYFSSQYSNAYLMRKIF